MQFSLAVPSPSQIVLPNSAVTYSVNVTALNHTTGIVALVANGLPPGASASFNLASVTNTGTPWRWSGVR